MQSNEEKNSTPTSRPADENSADSRRNFLKISVVLSAILAAGGIAAVTKSVTDRVSNSQGTVTPSTFPRAKISNISSLSQDQVVSFYYPLDNEPNILVKIGQKAVGGVGPDGDIVAFSQLCQHLGCDYAYQAPGTSPACDAKYKAPGPVGYCCCHGSIYDFTQGGNVVGGPALNSVPQVILEVDANGDIFATGMTGPPIFGHNAGSSLAASDLQGGNVVS